MGFSAWTSTRHNDNETFYRAEIMETSYSYNYSNTRSSSYDDSRNKRATSEISDRFYESMKTDLGRLRREFYTPEPISLTGNYYPRYRITGSMETGSCHVSYLARPYYFYDVPSRYGYSKFITVRKL